MKRSPRFLVFFFLQAVITSTAIGLLAQTTLPVGYIDEQRANYPDDDIIIHELKVRYDFRYNPSAGLVIVDQEGVMKLANLRAYDKSFERPFFGDETSELLKLKANRQKMSVDPTPYTSNGIFHSDANIVLLRTNVADGGHTTDVQYTYRHSDAKYLTRVMLSDGYPILSGEVSFHFPVELDIELPSFHTEGVGIERKESVEKGVKTVTFHIDRLPAYAYESQSSGRSFYMPHVLVLTRSAKTDAGQVDLMADAGDLYKWYASLVDQIGNDPSDLAAYTAELVEGCQDKECEMKRIFYWVQDNIRYIAFEDGIAGFRPEACQKVFSDRYGDCKGMANLMAEMLKSRGFDARLTWIGTNSIPYDYSLPSLAVDNHMICTVVDESGEYIFLDGTEKFIQFGDVAERIQGRQAMVGSGPDYEVVELPRFDFDRNTELTNVAYQVVDGELVGTIDYEVKGEGKVRMMNQYRGFRQKYKQDAKRMFFSKGDTDVDIVLRETTELDDREVDVRWGADFRAKNKVNSFGDELYLDWDIYKPYSRSDFDDERLEKLKGDMTFNAKVHDVEQYTIKAIEGYSLQSTPEDFDRSTDHFSISVVFDEAPNGDIGITKTFIVPEARIPNEALKDWDSAIKDLRKELYETPIVFKSDG